MDKTLFSTSFLSLVERDGYIFSREVRSNGIIVSLLPFKKNDEKISFLARFEICPAHGSEPELVSITGGLEPNQRPERCAVQELWEEAGYSITEQDLIALGTVRPSKSADTTVYLYAVDVTGKPQQAAPGDGSRFEQGASTQWRDRAELDQIVDPLFMAAVMRLESTAHFQSVRKF